MGLRAGEVAGLGLDDIDWRRGEITVRGKGGRRDRLPLPADVGAAIVAYLRDGRPAGALDRTVFIAAQAPREALSSTGITTIVAEAAARAGLPGPVHAHRLRHSAATAMLRGGGSLTEIGQALRHARPATTAIYAKVDVEALRPLGRPWPGGNRMTADGRPLTGLAGRLPGAAPRAGLQAQDRRPLLGQFVSWLDDRGTGHGHHRRRPGMGGAPAGASQAWQSIRLAAVRGFAAYLHGTDPSVQVPPPGLIRRGNDRATPYIYSDAEISAAHRRGRHPAAPAPGRHLPDPDQPARSTRHQDRGSALPRPGDLDADQGMLTIRDAKFGKTRLVPLHPSAAAALTRYSALRRRSIPVRPSPGAVRVHCRAPGCCTATSASRSASSRAQAGLARRSASCRPRIHDFRHSFAVAPCSAGTATAPTSPARMPLLSTYLGHADPAHTYWYYSDSRVIPIPAPLRA